MRFALCAVVVAFAAAPLSAQAPPNWKWLLDGPDTAWAFTQMPPGWHVTTGPGAVLYEPSATASGRFAVEMELFLFPETREAGYGIVLGGQGLDGTTPRYVSFLLRRDGFAAVERREGATTTALVNWIKTDSVPPHPGSDAPRQVLRVTVEADSVRFFANGGRVAALAREGLVLDGLVGLRVGPGVNVHVSNLDITRRLAPPRRRATGM